MVNSKQIMEVKEESAVNVLECSLQIKKKKISFGVFYKSFLQKSPISSMRAASPPFPKKTSTSSKFSHLLFYSISFFQKETFLFPTKKNMSLSFLQNSGDPPSKIDGSAFPHAQKVKKYDLGNL